MAASPTKLLPLVRPAPQPLAWQALSPLQLQWVLVLPSRLRTRRLPPKLRRDSGLVQILVLITRIIGEVSFWPLIPCGRVGGADVAPTGYYGQQAPGAAAPDAQG